jgi:hypothetical protein
MDTDTHTHTHLAAGGSKLDGVAATARKRVHHHAAAAQLRLPGSDDLWRHRIPALVAPRCVGRVKEAWQPSERCLQQLLKQQEPDRAR